MTEKFNKPIGWLVDEGLMLVDPNDKYAIPLYRHPAPRTPTKKMAKDRIEKLEAALRWIVEQEKQTAHPTVCEIVKVARKTLEGKDD